MNHVYTKFDISIGRIKSKSGLNRLILNVGLRVFYYVG